MNRIPPTAEAMITDIMGEVEPPVVMFTPPPVSGYRKLSQDDVDMINRVKQAGESLELLWLDVKEYIARQDFEARRSMDPKDYESEVARLSIAEPDRWAAMGRSDLQSGLMKLVRSIAQPSTFA